MINKMDRKTVGFEPPFGQRPSPVSNGKLRRTDARLVEPKVQERFCAQTQEHMGREHDLHEDDEQ